MELANLSYMYYMCVQFYPKQVVGIRKQCIALISFEWLTGLKVFLIRRPPCSQYVIQSSRIGSFNYAYIITMN